VSSPTTQNPDWALQNEMRGLRMVIIFECVMIAIAVVAGLWLRANLVNPTS
jgi:hypothetical protein